MINFTLSDSGKEEHIFYKSINIPIDDLRKRTSEYTELLLSILQSKLSVKYGIILSITSIEDSIYRIADNFLIEVHAGLSNEDILLGCHTIKNLPLFADFLIQKGYESSDKEESGLTMPQNTPDTILEYAINEIDYRDIERLEKVSNMTNLKDRVSTLIDNKKYLKASILLMKAKIIGYTALYDKDDSENFLSYREKLNNIFMY